MKQKFSKQRGFALLEIPIGLFIISVVLLFYIAASNTVVLNRNAKYQELASRIGISAMEDLRETDFAGIPPSGPLGHPLLGSLPSGSMELAVTDVEEDLKEIEITVNWKEQGENQRTVRFVSLVTKTGL